MKKLKKDHACRIEVPGLRHCVFCGGEAVVLVRSPMYGRCGAWVTCCHCHAHGPEASIYALIIKPGDILSTPLLPESLERGIKAAVDAWNSRSVDFSRMGNMLMKEAIQA